MAHRSSALLSRRCAPPATPAGGARHFLVLTRQSDTLINLCAVASSITLMRSSLSLARSLVGGRVIGGQATNQYARPLLPTTTLSAHSMRASLCAIEPRLTRPLFPLLLLSLPIYMKQNTYLLTNANKNQQSRLGLVFSGRD